MPDAAPMLLAYVAGPYRGASHFEVSQNIAAARAVAARLWAMGVAAICPHTNSAFLSGAAPEEVFLEGSLEMLRRSDLVVLVPGWERSSGTAAEIAEARRLDIPVFMAADPDEPDFRLIPLPTEGDDMPGRKIRCANCLHCKMTWMASALTGTRERRVRCAAGKWAPPAGREKTYALHTATARGMYACGAFSSMGEDDEREFLRDLREDLPVERIVERVPRSA